VRETFERYQCKVPEQLVPDQVRALRQSGQKKADAEAGFHKIMVINLLWQAA
jgi:hypothetical protein